MGPAVIPIASGILFGLSVIYDTWKKDPNVDLAKFIKGRQLEAAATAASHFKMEEATHREFAQARSSKLQGMVEEKKGLTEGWISPAELNIKGGGLAARDMPLVNMMAAQLGMDPQDLVARFDPARSNFYTPSDRRGEMVRPSLQNVVKQRVEDQGPAQMNPTSGFGL